MASGIATRIIVDGAYGDLSTTPSATATLLVGNDSNVQLYNDTDPGRFDNPGTLTLNPIQGAYTTTDITDGTNVGTTVANGNLGYNKGVVIFAGSTFVIYSGSMNNNYIEVDENANFNVIGQ